MSLGSLPAQISPVAVVLKQQQRAISRHASPILPLSFSFDPAFSALQRFAASTPLLIVIFPGADAFHKNFKKGA